MASFSAALRVILRHEGGYSNDPADSGGATNFGITAKTLGEFRNLGRNATPAEVRALSQAEAETIYRSRYWRPRYEYIESQVIATKVFDIGVNAGVVTAHRILQRSLGMCGHPVEIDGAFGPETLAATNACPPEDLIRSLIDEQAAHYRAIVALNPKKAKFLDGWLDRAAWPGKRNVESKEES
jgi:lysozyme family protein